LGAAIGVAGIGILAAQLPVFGEWSEEAVFWLLAAITVTSGGAMIAMRSPVYSAIWFAMALLGTAALFLFAGAQFLAVATIVVYAGAIVVMFLFVIMLAQPQGHEYYDRISWGSPAALFSAIAGAAMVVILTIAFTGLAREREGLRARVAGALADWRDGKQNQVLSPPDVELISQRRAASGEINVVLQLRRREKVADHNELARRIGQAVMKKPLQGHQLLVTYADHTGVDSPHHVATVGGALFGQYILAVEVAGTLLLVALVGAVAIVMHGRQSQGRRLTQRQRPQSEGAA
jgi:NADH-quinone oxidoreductase subunit J